MGWLERRRTQKLAGKILDRYKWSFGGGQNWFSTSANVPWPGSAGSTVSLTEALGIPAVVAVIRLLAETTGLVPLCTYQGEAPERDKARDSWQWERFHEYPNDEQSAFDFWQDVETSIETAGNAYIWKAISRRPIRDPEDAQFHVVDPFICRSVRAENGSKRFRIRMGGVEKEYGPDQILHLRGWTPYLSYDDAPSPIGLHRDVLGTMVNRETYENSFFENYAQTSIGIVVPEMVTDQEAQEIVDRFVQQHTGANAWKPALISGGGDLRTLQVPQRDAQYIEQKAFGIEDVCRIFHVSAFGMIRPGASPTSDDFERFLKVDLAPRLRRIEMGLRVDQDIYPAEDELWPEFLTDAVLRPDIQSRFAAYKDAAQGGWMSADEIRVKENLPVKGGAADELQQTPVGGAPNPQSNGQANGQVKEPAEPGY